MFVNVEDTMMKRLSALVLAFAVLPLGVSDGQGHRGWGRNSGCEVDI